MSTFEVRIDAAPLTDLLDRIIAQGKNLSEATRAIAAELESQAQANFSAGGRPTWQKKADGTPSRLIKSAMLIGSVYSDYGNGWASIGAGSGPSARYAAIHQFGGPAGRGGKTNIPARPYLPLIGPSENSSLQPEARESIEKILAKILVA